MNDSGLKILILTDGKIGDLVQCRGVASGLTDSDAITEAVVEPNWLTALPLPYMPVSTVDRQQSWMNTDANIVVASGRRTLPYLRALKNRRGRDCFTVFLKDPRFHHDLLDVIWAPEYDQLERPNTFATATSPHGINPQKLAAAHKTAARRFAEFGSPNVGLVLGGSAKSVRWDETVRAKLAAALRNLPAETNILVTASRRTPADLLESVTDALAGHHCQVWTGEDGHGENPYLHMLAWCDRLIVTGDSHNMVSEALASGAPVHIFRPEGLRPKIARFLDGLEASGHLQDLARGFDRQSGKKFDATSKICAEILRRFEANHQE